MISTDSITAARTKKGIEALLSYVCLLALLITPLTPVQAQVDFSKQSESLVKSATNSELAAQSTVVAFIAKLNAAAGTIYANSKNQPNLMRDGCRNLLNELLDLNAMAQSSSGEIWDHLTSSQRETFRLAFEHRMIANCLQRFGESSGEDLELVGIRRTDDGNLLATLRAGSQDDSKLSTWLLRGFGTEGLRAIDIVFEGRSIVADAQNEYAAVLQGANGNIDVLITYLQK